MSLRREQRVKERREPRIGRHLQQHAADEVVRHDDVRDLRACAVSTVPINSAMDLAESVLRVATMCGFLYSGADGSGARDLRSSQLAYVCRMVARTVASSSALDPRSFAGMITTESCVDTGTDLRCSWLDGTPLMTNEACSLAWIETARTHPPGFAPRGW